MISILCPCCNEEKTLPFFIERITETISKIPEEFEIMFVNDGSTDSTLDLLTSYSSKDSRVKVIDLSRNFGKEAALTAAFDYSSGDAVIPIDADLQDPPELIAEMIAKWHEGYEVVLLRHNNRSYDTGFKIIAAKLFYLIYNLISHPKIPGDVGDLRLTGITSFSTAPLTIWLYLGRTCIETKRRPIHIMRKVYGDTN